MFPIIGEVVIRTNGGKLTVNDSSADGKVFHYGYAEVVDVQKVAMASYHEHGTVPFLKVKEGHVEVTNEGWINAVHFTKDTDTSFKDIVITVKNEEMPKFSRDVVTCAENTEIKVCTVEVENTKDVIYLTNNGIYEQIKLAPVTGTTEGTKAFIEGNPSDSKINTAADQIANNWISEEVRPEWATTDTTRKLSDITNADEVAEADDVDLTAEQIKTASAVVEAGKEDWQAQKSSTFKGTGTKEDPFLIFDYATFQQVTSMYDEGYKYFKVKDGITYIDCSNWVPVNINGSFDGNNVQLLNIDARLFGNIGALPTGNETGSTLHTGWSTKDVVIKDYDAYFKLEGDLDAGAGMAKQILGNNTTTLSNINIYGQMVGGSNSGAFFCYTTGNPYDYNQNVEQKIILNDCHVYAKLVTAGTFGVVSGYPTYCNPTVSITVNNESEFWQGTGSTGSGKVQLYDLWDKVAGTTKIEYNVAKLNQPTISKNFDGTYSVTKASNAVRYTVYVAGQLTETDGNGNDTAVAGITMSLQKVGEFTFENSNPVIFGEITSATITPHQSKTEAVLNDGVLNVSTSGFTHFTRGTIKLAVSQYDSQGNLVGYSIITVFTVK